jgi:hypothetical protein
MSGVEVAAIAATAMQTAASVVKGVSALQQSRMQAKLTQREGDAALASAQVEQDLTLAEGERVMGEARAAAGASGFDLSGSASDIFARLAAERQSAAATSLYEGDMAKTNAYIEASQIKKAGKAEFIGSMLEAGATAISGGSSIAGNRSAARASQTAQSNAWMAQARARVPQNISAGRRISLTSRVPMTFGGG